MNIDPLNIVLSLVNYKDDYRLIKNSLSLINNLNKWKNEDINPEFKTKINNFNKDLNPVIFKKEILSYIEKADVSYVILKHKKVLLYYAINELSLSNKIYYYIMKPVNFFKKIDYPL